LFEYLFGVILGIIALVLVLSAALGLVYWAHKAETDRSARAGLYLIYGIPGILLTVAGLAVTIYGVNNGPIFLATGIGLTLPLIKSFRLQLAKVTPIDPSSPTDMSGLSVVLAVLGLLLAVSQTSAGQESSTEPVGYTLLVFQMIAFIAFAYIAVGAFVRRRFPESNARLGLLRPTFKTVGAAFVFFLITMTVGTVLGIVSSALQPEKSEAIDRGLESMTSGIQNPLGAVMIGVTAGIGEELLFRGALQPRFGIVLTSMVFALLHTNYGLSFVTLAVFAMGVVFGIQRQRYGTISAMITHALFNFVSVLAIIYT
jgi:uncharacterized protein